MKFNDDLIGREAHAVGSLDLDETLYRVDALSPSQAAAVEDYFFTGLTREEIVEVLENSLPTARRDWRLEKVWLTRELCPS